MSEPLPPPPPLDPAARETLRGTAPRGWVAGLLSVVLCGLGQLHAGRWGRALALYAGVVVIQTGGLLAFVHIRTEPLNLLLPLGVYVLYRIAVIVDAVRVARHAAGLRLRWFARWPIYVAIVVSCLYVGDIQIALVLRATVVEAFRMTAKSMSDTILPGDRLLVDKLFYTDPARRDVVVYRVTNAEGEEQAYIHRIIGLPGERVAILDGQVLIDGRELTEPYVRLDDSWRSDVRPFTVPPGSYFLLGDWRSRSRDSRDEEVGCVPRERIVGRAMTITDSTDLESGELRWNRVGRVIR